MDYRNEPLVFSSELWEWPARANWFFVSLPAEASADIGDEPRPPSGFGSVRVEVTIGSSTWRTSIFPDSSTGCYIVPVKKSVRVAERVEAPDTVEVELRLLD